jgi:hypothetical protein
VYDLDGQIVPEQFLKLEDDHKTCSLTALKCFDHNFLKVAPNKLKPVAYESRLEDLSNDIWFVQIG